MREPFVLRTILDGTKLICSASQLLYVAKSGACAMKTFSEVAATTTLITYRLEKMQFVAFFLKTQRDMTLIEKIIEELQPEDTVDSLQAVVDMYEERSR